MKHIIVIDQIKVIGKMEDPTHTEIAGDVRKLVKSYNAAVEANDDRTAEMAFREFLGFVHGVLYAHVVVKWRLEDEPVIH